MLRFGLPPCLWVPIAAKSREAIEEGVGLVSQVRTIRLRGHSHPYLRLCPVSRGVNTSGGGSYGGEGIEKDVVRNLATFSLEFQDLFRQAMQHPIRYADPMDLTKMLNIPPGSKTLDGVRDRQNLFYLQRPDV